MVKRMRLELFGKLLRFRPLLAVLTVGLSCAHTLGCQLIDPIRQPTVAERVAGLKTIFGGTVVGWVTRSGQKLMGPMPPTCLTQDKYYWYEPNMPSDCKIYLETSAALLRVDTPIVGPKAKEIIPVYMTWGDGDCNNDYDLGEQYLIAGDWFTQGLTEPIREAEILALRKMAAEPKFDFNTLYR